MTRSRAINRATSESKNQSFRDRPWPHYEDRYVEQPTTDVDLRSGCDRGDNV